MPIELLSSRASPPAGDAQFLPVRRHQPGSGPSSSGSSSSFAVSLQCAMLGNANAAVLYTCMLLIRTPQPVFYLHVTDFPSHHEPWTAFAF